MTFHKALRVTLVLTMCIGLAACGGKQSGNLDLPGDAPPGGIVEHNRDSAPTNYKKSSFWDTFGASKADQTVKVNKYIWAAALDVLHFLPVQSVDPFTGVIITDFGTPPGGRSAYRATIHVVDPALEARSLRISLHSRGGLVSAGTTRAVEDAILSRARQLRIADGKL